MSAKYRQKVEGVVLNSNSDILLVKAPNSKFWMLPGGGIKMGESLIMTAKRELKEECGAEIHEIVFLEELNRKNEYSKLSSGYRQTFAKGRYLGAEVFPFLGKVKCEDLLSLEDNTVYRAVTLECAIQIFVSQAKNQKEELFRWIETKRIEHIQLAFS